MARIRTVKPDLWASEQVTKCSREARLLFIGMWNFCDDSGIHTANCHRIRLEVFPDDGLCNETVEAWMNELIARELVDEYEVGGERYWIVTGWKKHQKIESPTFKFPLPSGEIPYASKTSTGSRRGVGDKSPNTGGEVADSSPPERKGIGKDLERNGRDSDCGEADSGSPPENPDDPIFLTFPTVGRDTDPKFYRVRESLISEFCECYPGVNVRGEVRKAHQWILANPGRKKTAKGMRSFLNNWMGREQNRNGGSYARNNQQQANPAHAKRPDGHQPRQFAPVSPGAPPGGQ